MIIGILLVIVLVLVGSIIYGISLSEKGYTGLKSDHFDGKKFFNPNAVEGNSFWNVLKWSINRQKGEWKENYETYTYPNKVQNNTGEEIKIMFVNHSTFLIQMDGLNILTDPVWAERASPLSWFGPKRLRVPGISLNSLPKIDLVLLTHNHYDHLDIETIKKIKELHNPKFIVPLGVDKILVKNKIADIEQLDWHQNIVFKNLTIGATPAIHFSGRGLMDRDNTLWCGFILEGSKRLYFVGDTAYDGNLFKEIGNRYSFIDIAIIPIGAYKPKWFMSPIHTDPEEAVKIHQDIRSKQSIACHFGTFQLSDENIDEVSTDLKTALELYNIQEKDFFMPDEGSFYRF